MAAPAYASDLVDILVDMPATTGWTALGGGASGLVAPETDFFIQGSNCISKAGWSTSTRGMIYNFGSGVTVPSGKAVYAWVYFWAPNSLATEAAGGLQFLIGSATTAFKQWYVRGSDTLVYGGWVCAVVDPTIAQDATTGAPGATLQYFGAQANVPAGGPSKGQPLGIDAMRYGRDFTCTNGDLANGYATFAGAAAFNDAVARRYGQFQAVDGGYLMQCRFLMGSASTPVDFRDSNRNITIARTTKVGSGFNRFEVVHASSNVSWTNINITALPGSASRGDFVMTDNAPTALTTCAFTDMGIWTFQSNGTFSGVTFRRCNLVTQGGALLSGCRFEATNDATRALLSNNPAQIQGCTFISGGTKHAIEITTPGTYSFSGNQFSGYGANGTTDAAIYNNSGGLVTLNVVGGGSTPTVRNGAGASTTVNSNVSVTLTGIKNPSEVRIFENGTTTQLAGQEDVTTGSFTFGVSAGQVVDIVVLSLVFQNFRLVGYSTNADATVPISQITDRQYANP